MIASMLALLRRRRTARLAVALAILIMANPPPAHAYIDFGVGSYAFQILIAWGLALAFAVRAFWGQIVAFVRKLLQR